MVTGQKEAPVGKRVAVRLRWLLPGISVPALVCAGVLLTGNP